MNEYELAVVLWSAIVALFVAAPVALVAIRALVEHLENDEEHVSVPSVPLHSHPSWPG